MGLSKPRKRTLNASPNSRRQASRNAIGRTSQRSVCNTGGRRGPAGRRRSDAVISTQYRLSRRAGPSGASACSGSLSVARLEDDDRDLPALRVALIHVVSAEHGHEFRPKSRSLLIGRDPGPNSAHGGTDLNASVLDAHQRRGPLHAAPSSLVSDQPDSDKASAREARADPAAAQPIHSDVNLGRPPSEVHPALG